MKIRFLLLLVLLFPSASAMKLSLLPAHIFLSGEINKDLCQQITISSNENILLNVEDKWSAPDKINPSFQDYTLNSIDLALSTSYLRRINLDKKATFNFCVNVKNPGTYKGVLLFNSEGPGAIGSLIKLNIEDKTNAALKNFVIFNSALLFLLFILVVAYKINAAKSSRNV